MRRAFLPFAVFAALISVSGCEDDKVPPQCPVGTQPDANGNCIAAPGNCQAGQTYDAATAQCLCAPGSVMDPNTRQCTACPAGTEYVGATKQCAAACAAGQTRDANGACVASAGGGACNATAMPLASAPSAIILNEIAKQQLDAGMQPDGATIVASFTPGQCFEQAITIQAGRCYAVVGLGINMTELDVELVVQQPPAPEFVASTDQTTGPQAILGAKGQCFKNPFPIAGQGKVRIKATGGQGIAAAQVFVK